jgi:hypothetical protein
MLRIIEEGGLGKGGGRMRWRRGGIKKKIRYIGEI